MGSAVALLGFAGAANASATIDLVWIDVSTTSTSGAVICLRAANRDCPVIGSQLITTAVASDNITLAVIITAGPVGSAGGSVSVNYSDVVPQLSVTGFQSLTTTKPFFYLPLALGTAFDSGTVIDGLNAGAAPDVGEGLGIGLPSGVTAYLGTVSFHQDTIVNGTFTLDVNADGALDGVLDIFGNDITSTTTFNDATLVNVPEPGALSLLVMGVGGMLLAGRGRRS
jgi:hypothetical protein